MQSLFEGLQLGAGVHISLKGKYFVNLSLTRSPEKWLDNHSAQKRTGCAAERQWRAEARGSLMLPELFVRR